MTAVDRFELLHGDCRTVLRTLATASVDSIVTDPPYELGFMGKGWDSTGVANDVEMWREVLRVLKPGGHLLAFSGTRTYHRMVCAIEDAGFEVRDRTRYECSPETKFGPLWASLNDEQRGALLELLNDQLGLGSELAWEYGSGFPKSLNLGDAWEGWGTALKPAHEPICIARKPLAGTVEANVLRYGVGALNVDACRVPTDEALRAGAGGIPCRHDENVPRGRAGEASVHRRYTNKGGTDFAMKPGPRGGDLAGRWPANVIHDGSPEVLRAFAQFGEDKGQVARLDRRNSEKMRNTFGVFTGTADADFAPHDTLGSAARFFYCAKATRVDRNEGCEHMKRKPLHWSSGHANPGSFQSDGTDKTSQNHHPTVKPTELMAYLCRLVTPPGGLVLDPFMGSGSTGKAAMLEGFRFIGIELELEYLNIARARIEFAARQGFQPGLFETQAAA
ncbi:site-specific DNA-methyltransferase [Burkholderia contaminans]|uniref:DNA-methyltransferase n=1 Tax=Burkholderia contaminans TaxID=488447 RepID=UPI001CF17302|nr:DNA methyltransferase [Burkholderia contaminans]MCA7889986.1 site-specific DNA-methyltransferase [Burkholderia contaminans]